MTVSPTSINLRVALAEDVDGRPLHGRRAGLSHELCHVQPLGAGRAGRAGRPPRGRATADGERQRGPAARLGALRAVVDQEAAHVLRRRRAVCAAGTRADEGCAHLGRRMHMVAMVLQCEAAQEHEGQQHH